MRRTTTTAALLLACAAAGAQDAAETEPTAVPSYTVEVIVFEYAEDVGVGTEQFLPEELLQAYDEAADGELVFGDATMRPVPGQRDEADRDADAGAWDAEPDFTRRDETEFTMTDVASRLERLDVYRPLMHFAWTQVTRPEEKTRPIELRELAEPADGLDGSFALYLSRYLHLVVDLGLERYLESLLFETSSTDPATWVAVCGVLLGTALGGKLTQLVARTIDDLYFAVQGDALVVDPLVLAKELATLSTMSGGRLLPAFGLGVVDPIEQQAFGVERSERAGLFDESLAVMRKCWSGEPFAHHGARFRYDGIVVRPAPTRMDVWLGGSAPSELRRVGRLADGWLPSF